MEIIYEGSRQQILEREFFTVHSLHFSIFIGILANHRLSSRLSINFYMGLILEDIRFQIEHVHFCMEYKLSV